jgi:putative transposase
MDEQDNRVAREWRMPDEMWERIEALLPRLRRHPKGGRPWIDNRKIADGIFYVLRTGCQWKAVPREFGSGSTLHRRFQQWVQRGVFRKLWQAGLFEYDELKGIQWEWQALDGAMTKAPLGGEKMREKPDRSGEERYQAFLAHRRRRRTAGAGGRRSQSA